eukprot:IDg769t1
MFRAEEGNSGRKGHDQDELASAVAVVTKTRTKDLSTARVGHRYIEVCFHGAIKKGTLVRRSRFLKPSLSERNKGTECVLCIFARPRFDRHRKRHFDWKIGIWLF